MLVRVCNVQPLVSVSSPPKLNEPATMEHIPKYRLAHISPVQLEVTIFLPGCRDGSSLDCFIDVNSLQLFNRSGLFATLSIPLSGAWTISKAKFSKKRCELSLTLAQATTEVLGDTLAGPTPQADQQPTMSNTTDDNGASEVSAKPVSLADELMQAAMQDPPPGPSEASDGDTDDGAHWATPPRAPATGFTWSMPLYAPQGSRGFGRRASFHEHLFEVRGRCAPLPSHIYIFYISLERRTAPWRWWRILFRLHVTHLATATCRHSATPHWT